MWLYELYKRPETETKLQAANKDSPGTPTQPAPLDMSTPGKALSFSASAAAWTPTPVAAPPPPLDATKTPQEATDGSGGVLATPGMGLESSVDHSAVYDEFMSYGYDEDFDPMGAPHGRDLSGAYSPMYDGGDGGGVGGEVMGNPHTPANPVYPMGPEASAASWLAFHEGTSVEDRRYSPAFLLQFQHSHRAKPEGLDLPEHLDLAQVGGGAQGAQGMGMGIGMGMGMGAGMGLGMEGSGGRHMGGGGGGGEYGEYGAMMKSRGGRRSLAASFASRSHFAMDLVMPAVVEKTQYSVSFLLQFQDKCKERPKGLADALQVMSGRGERGEEGEEERRGPVPWCVAVCVGLVCERCACEVVNEMLLCVY